MTDTATIDLAHIAEAGQWAARQLDQHGHARLTLTPGDATAYTITIVAPSAEHWQGNGGWGSRDYLVGVNSLGGGLYPWAAAHALHASYCATHWGRGASDMHTGTVLAAFLNAVWAALTI